MSKKKYNLIQSSINKTPVNNGWKSSIETIHDCPIVNNSQGIIKISPDIISTFAGAVKDSHEWLAVLLGTTSVDNMEVTVTSLYVPPNQTRSTALCDIDEAEFPFPDNIKQHLVGVIHSHNSMEPVFSGTDLGVQGLCTRYPVSIVISSNLINPACNNKYEATLLGFDYTAVGRYKLPCGAYGKSNFKILPLNIEDWPIDNQIIKATHQYPIVDSLSECQRWNESKDNDKYKYKRLSDCGLEEQNYISRTSIFGTNGEVILSNLPKPEVRMLKPGSRSKDKSQTIFDAYFEKYSSIDFDALDDIYNYSDEDYKDHKDLDYWLSKDNNDRGHID